MANFTGRTIPHFAYISIEDMGGVMRNILLKSIPELGLDFDKVDVSAVEDAIKRQFPSQAAFDITLVCPFSNAAAVTAAVSGAAPTDSGAFTVLQPLAGSMVARSFGAYFGVQQVWTAGDPVFGGIDTINCGAFKVSGDTCSLNIFYAGNAVNALAWGSSLITAS